MVVFPEPVGPVTSDEPPLLGGQLEDDLRKPQLLAGRRGGAHSPEHERDGASLVEGVHPEAGEPGHRVGEVHLVVPVERLGDAWRRDRRHDCGRVLRFEREFVDQRPQVAVDPHARRGPRLQVQVRALPLIEKREQAHEFGRGHDALAYA